MGIESWPARTRPKNETGPRASAQETVESAHELVREIRGAYLASDWQRADQLTLDVVDRATRALYMAQEIPVPATFDMDASRTMTRQLFGERMADEIFGRLAEYRHEGRGPHEDETAAEKRVRRSIAVSCEYVALVECYVSM